MLFCCNFTKQLDWRQKRKPATLVGWTTRRTLYFCTYAFIYVFKKKIKRQITIVVDLDWGKIKLNYLYTYINNIFIYNTHTNMFYSFYNMEW